MKLSFDHCLLLFRTSDEKGKFSLHTHHVINKNTIKPRDISRYLEKIRTLIWQKRNQTIEIWKTSGKDCENNQPESGEWVNVTLRSLSNILWVILSSSGGSSTWKWNTLCHFSWAEVCLIIPCEPDHLRDQQILEPRSLPWWGVFFNCSNTWNQMSTLSKLVCCWRCLPL